jgi:hypothetical protein
MAFPENNLNQTCVYWGNPTADGSGGFTWDDPIELDCRWEEKTELIRTSKGDNIVSNASVQVKQDLDENGWLFLGDLDDLDSSEEDDPMTISNAYEIKKFDKIPTMKADKFYRRAWL